VSARCLGEGARLIPGSGGNEENAGHRLARAPRRVKARKQILSRAREQAVFER